MGGLGDFTQFLRVGQVGLSRSSRLAVARLGRDPASRSRVLARQRSGLQLATHRAQARCSLSKARAGVAPAYNGFADRRVDYFAIGPIPQS